MSSQKGNNVELETFFREEYGSMKRYINSRLRASTDRDAEDIIQDVAVKLFTLDSRSPINNVAGFVYRSIRNKIIDVMRKKKVSYASDNLESKEDLLTEDGNEFFSEELKAELELAIENLKAPFRDIIVAFDIEGYSYKEISQETGIPEGTLMSRRHRAIAELHKKLKKEIY